MATKNSSSKNTKTKTNGKTSPKKVNYTFNPKKETATQYNARVASERGDSSSQLSSMQKATEKAYSSRGLDVNKLSASPVSVDDLGAPAQKMTLPDVPKPTDVGGMMDANNFGLASQLGQFGITYDKGQFTQGAQPQAGAQDNYANLFEQYLGALPKPVDTASIYAKEARAADLEAKRQAVTNYTSQLNQIQANAQADQLKLEGQGRGVTDVIIGGQQAQIAREAAIRALPVQAQLAAAQGDLELAQTHVDKMFQIKSQDAQAQYQWKSQVISTVYQFASQQEQRRLDEIRRKEDRAWETEKMTLSLANDVAKTAIEYGQGGLLTALSEAKTPQEVMAIQGRLRKPVSTTQRAPTTASSGGVTYQYDYATGKWSPIAPGNQQQNSTMDGKPQNATQAKVNGYADRLTEANKIIADLGKEFTHWYSYGNILPNQLQTDDRQNFEQAKTNFITAVLRQESGAVISDSEFKRAESQYFPKPGDSASQIAQKEANRNTVINSFYREANVQRPAMAGDIIESNGQQYKVAEDGITLIPL